MAKGKLGALDLTTVNNTLLFTAAAPGSAQVFNVRFCNRGATPAKVRVAITPNGSGAPANADWVTYDVSVGVGGIIEDTGLVASDTEKVWVRADTANAVSVRAHGV